MSCLPIIVLLAFAVGCQTQQPQPHLALFIADREASDMFTRPIETGVEMHGTVYTTDTPFLSEAQVANVYWTVDAYARPALGMHMTDEGAVLMRAATKGNQQKFLVIELDDTLICAPFIQGTISQEAIISFSGEDALVLLDAFAVSMGGSPFIETVAGKALRRPVIK